MGGHWEGIGRKSYTPARLPVLATRCASHSTAQEQQFPFSTVFRRAQAPIEVQSIFCMYQSLRRSLFGASFACVVDRGWKSQSQPLFVTSLYFCACVPQRATYVPTLLALPTFSILPIMAMLLL
ncbi:hypothetical protein K432DRAFT_387619 [Lepidopterella palustris CBS 459.81]|uniref:Uncharacterized protein n=1 Tax=Lepidopterella palustris CBS 459.81 TaxID=1314670 RepID=A0A8E2DWB7_9PEZI|nr:hypothetical protein K432DRAFT_387619 [Lepidopterella palustris CBS 459.81]